MKTPESRQMAYSHPFRAPESAPPSRVGLARKKYQWANDAQEKEVGLCVCKGAVD